MLTFWWHVYAKTITGKLFSVGINPPHLITLIGPLSAIVSPFAKWYTTSTTRYEIDTNATMLVYFRESRRRRKESGITTNLPSSQQKYTEVTRYGSYMKTVTQKCLSTRKGMASASSFNPLTTPGMRSPIMIK